MAVSKNSQRKKAEKEKQLVDHSVDFCYFADSCWSRIFGTAKISKRSCTGKPETIKVEAAEKSYAAGSRISEKISAYTEYPGKRNSFWMQIHTACHRLKCRHMATVLP